MTKRNFENLTQKGSIMIEALALLGLITMVTPILYRKAAERTTELQDINIATQLRMISNAADNYIKDNYSTISTTHSDATFTLTADEREKLKEYLPAGVTLDANRLFSSYDIGVRRNVVTDQLGNNHNIYTTSVLGALAEDFTMARSSKIASMIGANGGVYRETETDSGEAGGEDSSEDSSGKVTGVQGIWSAELKDYGLASVKPKNGSLMVISSDAISSARGDVGSDQALYRVAAGGDKNKMQTTLSMGGNPITQVTNLVADSNSTSKAVTIGDNSNASNLIVQGATTLNGALGVSGATTLKDTLTVSDGKKTTLGGELQVKQATTLNSTLTVMTDVLKATKDSTSKKETVSVSGGALTATKDSSNNKAVSVGGTLGVSGATTLDGNLTVMTDVLKATKDSSGNKEVSVGGTLGVSEATTLGGNLTVMTDVLKVINDNGSKTVTIGAPLTVKEDATFEKDVSIDGALKAKWLKASEGITLGSEYGSGNVNLTPSVATISVSGDASITSTGGAASVSGKTGVSMKSSDGAASVSGTTASITATDGAVTLAAQAKSTNKSKLVLGNDGSWEITSVDENGELSSDGAYLKFAHGSTDVLIDDTGFALSKSGSAVGDWYQEIDEYTQTPKASLNKNAAVSISRLGIVDVTGGDAGSGGNVIRARRLVSDIVYPTDKAFKQEGSYASDGDHPYDYYQVNPAYTSVMNDIKLATRGGARLSDILPDFINKGIYVLDNTYLAEKVESGQWPAVSNGEAASVDECDTSTCIASPWLGFVPTPQCPRNYARAITVNPIRWRMSEVYSVYQADKLETYANATDKKAYTAIVSGADFSKHFMRITDPKEADFELSAEEGNTSAAHTHYVTRGFPLTFQTNTFLNTSLSSVGTSGKDDNNNYFQGWHVLMGFLYRPGQYGAVLKDILGSYDSNSIYWNVFPVYAQNMAAFATVYCYFNRHPKDTDGERTWVWGSSGPVDTYDQMNNFRLGFARDDWNVNDPDLKYDDAW